MNKQKMKIVIDMLLNSPQNLAIGVVATQFVAYDSVFGTQISTFEGEGSRRQSMPAKKKAAKKTAKKKK